MKIIIPPAIPKKGTLGVIAPSSPIDDLTKSTIEKGYDFLRKHGLKLIEAPNIRKRVGHTAGTIQDRVKAIHNFFQDPSINGIISFWGGANSHQLLEYLDFDLIKKNPKALIGYSDLTSLQNGLFTKTGLVSFSGPAVITFCKPKVPQYTWDYFQKFFLEIETSVKITQSKTYCDNLDWEENKMHFKKSSGWKVFQKGKSSGRVLGGHLKTFMLLAGTPYFPKIQDAILFTEFTGSENSESIDRLFTQLRHMGVFDKISGLVIGRFESTTKFTSKDSFEMILSDALKGYSFPVIYNLDFGHADPIFTFPIGGFCILDTSKLHLNLTLQK